MHILHLASEIEEVYAERIKQVETRKHSLIGTNIYANPVDELPTEVNPQFADVKRISNSIRKLTRGFCKKQRKNWYFNIW